MLVWWQTNYTKWCKLRLRWTLQLPNEIWREIHNFVWKFTIWLTTMYYDIAKFIANFGKFKWTSETICQKFCEVHCNESKLFKACNEYKTF